MMEVNHMLFMVKVDVYDWEGGAAERALERKLEVGYKSVTVAVEFNPREVLSCQFPHHK